MKKIAAKLQPKSSRCKVEFVRLTSTPQKEVISHQTTPKIEITEKINPFKKAKPVGELVSETGNKLNFKVATNLYIPQDNTSKQDTKENIAGPNELNESIPQNNKMNNIETRPKGSIAKPIDPIPIIPEFKPELNPNPILENNVKEKLKKENKEKNKSNEESRPKEEVTMVELVKYPCGHVCLPAPCD